MDNDEMRELAPALRGKMSAEFGFDLDRIVAVDDSQQIGDAFDVRIDRESRNVECVAENHVRRFTSDSGQGGEFLHRVRHFAVEIGCDSAAGPDDVCAFCPVVAAAPDDLLQFGGIGICEFFRSAVSGEQIDRYDVDHHIRALRGKNRRHQQLKRVRVMERTDLRSVFRFRSS